MGANDTKLTENRDRDKIPPWKRQIKSGFRETKPAKMSTKPGFCYTEWFMKVWTKSENRFGLKRPKTGDKPIVNLPKNQVLLSFVSSRVDKPGL
jgi:hypothetical protein